MPMRRRRTMRRKRAFPANAGLWSGRQGTVKVFRKVSTRSKGPGSVPSLQVFMNPFSQAETQPIIPDGKAVTSVGQRLQSIQTWTLQGSGTVDYMTFILYPGFGAGLGIFDSTQPATCCQSFTNHGGWDFQPHQDATTTIASVYNAANQNTVQGGNANTWRLVSSGLRLSLVNNSDQNDGWWEAIRVTPSNDPTLWCFTPSSFTNSTASFGTAPNVLINSTDLRICPSATDFNNVYNGNFIDNPTYVSGKVRDLHKHVFQLHPNNTDHDFRLLKPTYNLTANDAVTVDQASFTTNGQSGALQLSSTGSSIPGANVTKDGANVSDLVNGNIDLSFDIVIIRVHGRILTGGSPTKILSHLISNQEVCYAEGTFLERFQRRPPVATRRLTAMSAMLHKTSSPLLYSGRMRRRGR